MVKSVTGLGQPETLYKSPKPTVCGVWSRACKWQISNGLSRQFFGASWRADGQRFLAAITTGEPETPAENIVINWMAPLPGRR